MKEQNDLFKIIDFICEGTIHDYQRSTSYPDILEVQTPDTLLTP